jgi:hypothetical protein
MTLITSRIPSPCQFVNLSTGLSPALIGIIGIFAHRSSEPPEQSYEGEQHASTPLMFGPKSSIWTPSASATVSG